MADSSTRLAGGRGFSEIMAKALATMAAELPEADREAFRERLRRGESGQHVLDAMAEALEHRSPEIRFGFINPGWPTQEHLQD